MDFCKFVQEFFKQNWILPEMNSNVVSLIPKTPSADLVKDFRSIVVTNFKFKIISKILADRLAIVAARIISPNQYASEALNMLSKKVRGGNVTYKVDIHKALDTLSWKFLLLVFTRFGFHSSFVI